MSEENTDVKQEEVTDPSPEASAETQKEEKTPEGEKPSSETEPENNEEGLPFHKHPRFQEVISEKNQLKERLSQMEKILNEKLLAPKETYLDEALKELEELGIEKKAAQKILNAVSKVSKGQVESRVAPVELSTVQREIDSWLSDFKKEHTDYEELEPQMYSVFSALPQQTQALVASDPMGVQLLYDHVKAQNMSKEIEKAKKDATEQAYKSKQSKLAGSRQPAGSKNTPGELTRKSLAEMSMDEYKKRRKEILSAIDKLAQEAD